MRNINIKLLSVSDIYYDIMQMLRKLELNLKMYYILL